MSFEIKYKLEKNLSSSQVENLYSDAQWSAYTMDINQLMRGIQNSLDVISAWHGDKLVGLIRTIGDQETIIYIQDILVHTAFRRQGIGRALMKLIIEKYKSVRQLILLTDNQPSQKAFYENLGFEDCSLSNCIAYQRK